LFRAGVIFRTENLINSFFLSGYRRVLRGEHFWNNCSAVGNAVLWPLGGRCYILNILSLGNGLALYILLLIGIAIYLRIILDVGCLVLREETRCELRFVSICRRGTVPVGWGFDCLANLSSIEIVAHWAFGDLPINLLEALI
jgi:hypothetical protein